MNIRLDKQGKISETVKTAVSEEEFQTANV